MVNGYDLVYIWMCKHAHSKVYQFFGYAIMPNHAHFIIRVPEDGAINTILGNGKRFMAYEITKRLLAIGRNNILEQLGSGLRPSDLARRQKHCVFTTSTDLIACFSGKMIEEKLKYIHADAVSRKWQFTNDAEEYPHSSFAFFVRGEQCAAPLVAYHEFGFLDGKGALW